MPIKRKESKRLDSQRAKMHEPCHEIGKQQKQSAFEENDPTINFKVFAARFCSDAERSRLNIGPVYFVIASEVEAATQPRTAFRARPGFQIP